MAASFHYSCQKLLSFEVNRSQVQCIVSPTNLHMESLSHRLRWRTNSRFVTYRLLWGGGRGDSITQPTACSQLCSWYLLWFQKCPLKKMDLHFSRVTLKIHGFFLYVWLDCKVFLSGLLVENGRKIKFELDRWELALKHSYFWYMTITFVNSYEYIN